MIEDKHQYSKEEQLYWIDCTKQNLDYVDWKGKFAYGISILGGEIFYIKDREIQLAFLDLIDAVIDKVLIPCQPTARYSFVSNGLYDTSFLFEVVDKVRDRIGVHAVDANFSYDMKYRYANENARRLAMNTINTFADRYNYQPGVQMILTQYVIDMWKSGQFDVVDFMRTNFPKGNLCFLYPHPINTGIDLPDFQFKRKDFFEFMVYLKERAPRVYHDFINSTKNSGTFKYTGLDSKNPADGVDYQPVLSNGKEYIQERCGHSTLYKCYSDSDKCVLCDLHILDADL